jgi:DNA (cytosine-5)-methyltransferase 1
VRLLKELRPRWFVWENVPGVFGTNKGEDFKAFIRTINECGYSCAWRVLDAQYVRVDGFPRAVPQRRRRVFVVGHIGTDWRYPAEVLFEQQGLFGSCPPSRFKGDKNSGAVKDIAEHWCYDNQTYAREPAYTGDICCTLQSHIGAGGNTKPIIVSLAYTQNTAGVMSVSTLPNPPRMITPVECERLMGFPDNWTRIPWKGKPAEQCPDGHRYRACGNSMCVNVMRWIGMRIDRVDKMEKEK